MADTGCRLPVCELEPTPDSEIKLRDTWHWPNREVTAMGLGQAPSSRLKRTWHWPSREVTAMTDLQDDFDRSVAIHTRPVDTGHRDD